MEVAGILAGIGGLRGIANFIGDRLSVAEKETSPAEGQAANAQSAPASQGSLRPLLSDVDLRNTSPRELSRLAHRLFAAGVITAGEFQELTSIRAELEAAAVAPDQKVDIIGRLTEQLDQSQSAPSHDSPAADYRADQTRRQLDLLARLSTLRTAQAAGHRQTVDAVV
jgi:hypothetical protein